MKVKKFGHSNKIYDQEKIKSSFFVKYMAKDDMLILVGVSIAHSNEIIKR